MLDVAEVIFQTMTYRGVPTMIEGLRVLKSVLNESGAEVVDSKSVDYTAPTTAARRGGVSSNRNR